MYMYKNTAKPDMREVSKLYLSVDRHRGFQQPLQQMVAASGWRF